MKTTPLLAALALAGFHMPALADAGVQQIDVTAIRLPANAADLPINLTVISRDDIDRSAANTLPELLADAAGITVRNLDATGNGSIDMGGFGIAGASNTLILLDGVKLNDDDLSSPRLAAIALDRIDRIEIVGGSSVAWGGGATGGVINIITRQGKGGIAAARLGSFGTAELTGGAGFGDALTLRLDGRTYRSEGYRDNSDHSAHSGSAELGYKLDAATRFSLGVAREDEHYRFAGPRHIDTATGVDEFDNDPWGTDTPNDHGEVTNTRYTVHGEGSTGTLRWALDGSARRKTVDSHFEDAYQGISLDHREIHEERFSPRASYAFGPADLALGIDLGHARMEDANQYDSPTYNFAGTGTSEQHTRAFWLDTGYRIAPGTRVTAGGRIEHVDDKVYGSGALLADHSQSPKAFELGVRQMLGMGVSAFVRYGQSYRLGNADELTQNPGLRTQTSHDVDAGIEGRFGPGHWRVAAFLHDLNDEIAYQPFFNGFGQNINLAPTRHEGLSADWSARVDALDYGVNLTWQDATFRSGNYGSPNPATSGDVSGKQVPLVPHWQGNLHAGWAWSDATRADVALHGVGRSRLDNDELNTGAWLGGYATLDAKISHKVGNMTLSLSGQNLADKHYASYGIRSPFTLTSYNLYPEAGRRFMAAASYAF